MSTYTVDDILTVLNDRKIRATYSAVGAVVGIHPRNLAPQLGDKRSFASWAVSKKAGMPSNYLDVNLHRDLQHSSRIIEKPDELISLLECEEVVDRSKLIPPPKPFSEMTFDETTASRQENHDELMKDQEYRDLYELREVVRAAENRETGIPSWLLIPFISVFASALVAFFR